MDVYIDKERVSKIAKGMNSNLEDFYFQINCLLDTVGKLEGVWQGNDADKHINGINEECVSELKRFSDVVSEYIEYLDNVPSCYDSLDNVFASKNISSDRR